MRRDPRLSGSDLRRSLTLANRLGCRVAIRRGTGELSIQHPGVPRPVRIDGRRKDAPRHLTVFLKRVMRLSR